MFAGSTLCKARWMVVNEKAHDGRPCRSQRRIVAESEILCYTLLPLKFISGSNGLPDAHDKSGKRMVSVVLRPPDRPFDGGLFTDVLRAVLIAGSIGFSGAHNVAAVKRAQSANVPNKLHDADAFTALLISVALQTRLMSAGKVNARRGLALQNSWSSPIRQCMSERRLLAGERLALRMVYRVASMASGMI